MNGSEAGSEIESRPKVPQEDEDLLQYQFGKFAATYFQGNANSSYVRKPLRYPLLQHENVGDQIVSADRIESSTAIIIVTATVTTTPNAVSFCVWK